MLAEAPAPSASSECQTEAITIRDSSINGSTTDRSRSAGVLTTPVDGASVRPRFPSSAVPSPRFSPTVKMSQQGMVRNPTPITTRPGDESIRTTPRLNIPQRQFGEEPKLRHVIYVPEGAQDSPGSHTHSWFFELEL